MDEGDLELRNLTYRLFVERGRGPTAAEVGHAAGLTVSAVHAGWRRLHESHALVLNGATMEIRMANPFFAVPTAYRVHARGRSWYANCAWDAFGIPAALQADGGIDASCPDCGQLLTTEVRDQRPDDDRLLFHCLVPAARWWDDIGFHLKHDESLPVGRAHRTLARRAPARRNHPGRQAERTCT